MDIRKLDKFYRFSNGPALGCQVLAKINHSKSIIGTVTVFEVAHYVSVKMITWLVIGLFIL
jgi:hypothetical protein